jgi:hypothetical protein
MTTACQATGAPGVQATWVPSGPLRMVFFTTWVRVPLRLTVTGSLQVTVPWTVARPVTRLTVPSPATVSPSSSGSGAGGLWMLMVPRRAGSAPSQCCSKVATKSWT